MKTIFKSLVAAVSLVAIAMGSYSFIAPQDVKVQRETIEECMDCRYDQCHATAKSTGQRCKHCVSNYGDTYCWQHQ
ncbi:MAG: hypothetical protein ACK45H_01685 [Bacteroidota bacterium]|jgi:hypothetical protein